VTGTWFRFMHFDWRMAYAHFYWVLALTSIFAGILLKPLWVRKILKSSWRESLGMGSVMAITSGLLDLLSVPACALLWMAVAATVLNRLFGVAWPSPINIAGIVMLAALVRLSIDVAVLRLVYHRYVERNRLVALYLVNGLCICAGMACVYICCSKYSPGSPQ
jgi:hypothetical protein